MSKAYDAYKQLSDTELLIECAATMVGKGAQAAKAAVRAEQQLAATLQADTPNVLANMPGFGRSRNTQQPEK